MRESHFIIIATSVRAWRNEKMGKKSADELLVIIMYFMMNLELNRKRNEDRSLFI